MPLKSTVQRASEYESISLRHIGNKSLHSNKYAGRILDYFLVYPGCFLR